MHDLEQSLSDVLHRRADSVGGGDAPPPDLIRRARRTRTNKLAACAAAALVVVGTATGAVLTGGGDDGAGTVVAGPPETAATTGPAEPSTTAPPTIAPVYPQTEEFPGFYPDSTWDELRSHEAERRKSRGAVGGLDLDSVVRQYLGDHGITDPELTPSEGAGSAAVVVYASQGASGTVRLERVGDDAYTITAATAEAVQRLQVTRDAGQLDVIVDAAVEGTVQASVAPLRSELGDESSARVTPGTPLTFTLHLPHPSDPAVLRVEHRGADGRQGFIELRVDAQVVGTGARLDAGSALDADRLGPVSVGMTFAAARKAAAAPTTLELGPYCDSLEADGLPGVFLVRPLTTSGVTLVFVTNGKTRTSAGVGIGSTVAEVVRAHGDPTRRGAGDEWLAYERPDGFGLRFDVVDGRVVGMTAGRGVSADEHCA